MNNYRDSDIWIRDQEGIPHLLGSKCIKCGRLSFPAKQVCPYCMTNGESEEVLFGQKGKVVSVTICHTAPMGMQAPYFFGLVSIEGGVQVLAQISGNQIEKGDQVELIIYPIPSEQSTKESFGWRYQLEEGGN